MPAGVRRTARRCSRPRTRKAEEDAEQRLPKLDEGQAVTCAEAEALAKQTKPPARYNESSLLRAMETAGKLVEDDEAAEAMKESGLGTPATRAATIERLIDAAYLEREGKQLRATPKAVGIITTLGDHDLTSPALTGEWERRLVRDRGRRGVARRVHARHPEVHRGDRRLVRRQGSQRRCASSDASSGPARAATARSSSAPRATPAPPGSRRPSPAAATLLWKEVGGRTITFEEAQEYVSKGISADDLKPERVVIGPCPTPGCGGEIIERAKSYGCTSWKSRSETGCGFVIWRRSGGKDVTREEAIEMVREGRTNATAEARCRAARAVPDRGLRRRDRREGAQLRVHLVEEQEEARLRLRDLEDTARTRS